MTPWGRAITALRLLSIDPVGLGGIALRARTGPARDAFIAALPATRIRLHPALSTDALDGGIDIAQSLASKTLVHHPGLLTDPDHLLLLSMAERLPPLMAARLSAALDRGLPQGLIALDEGAEPDERVPAAIADRLAFHVTLDGLGHHDVTPLDPPLDLPLTRRALAKTIAPQGALDELVRLAVTLGITSLRAPSLALHAARANAALNRRNSVSSDDILVAAELVYAPRATQLPEPASEAPEPQRDPPENTQAQDTDITALPQDILLEAIKTALPPDLLSHGAPKTPPAASGSGAGQKKTGNRRGRPLPAREGGAKGSQPRVDLIATLRAAVPWQTLRRTAHPDRTGPIIHPTDLRYKRFQDLSDRLLVFAVDASGSAALARLAEAKGAVELLLAEAYARRDHVALISFRGEAAETLLPPTRSLVQTKRRLADLPGGGGTPLASGLKASLETAQGAFRKGLSPVIVLLTDGRSNIALDGTADRAQAASDATQIAAQIAQADINTIVIDTGKRPEQALKSLATSLRGHYVSLPRADARALSDTVTTALEG